MKKRACKTAKNSLISSETHPNLLLLSFRHHTVSKDVLLEGYNDVTWLSSALETGKDINRKSLKYELYKEKMLQ